jgi:peptidoglycan/xylan/chitin deacetylase (PgdA/CDA1 family)
MTPATPRSRRRLLPLIPLGWMLLWACQERLVPEGTRQEGPQGSTLESGEVIVSFTFDDGRASQADAGGLLEAYGMRGTFYINSGRIGLPGYLGLEQLHRLQDAGHEIGGHTVSHAALATLDVPSQLHQICDDRVALMDAGLRITSFAYPSGSQNLTTQQLVAACGYNSSRESGGLAYPGICSGCPYAETVPPKHPHLVRTHGSLRLDMTLEDLRNLVLRAEDAGGGWVPLVFHHLCEPCDGAPLYSVSLSTLRDFLEWLAPRAARGTYVRTMDQVMGGVVHAPVPGPAPDAGTPDPTQLLKNPSLEDDGNADGVPDCWQLGGFGENAYTWSRTSDAHGGSQAQQLLLHQVLTGDRKLISRQDPGVCAPALTPGHRYRLSAWYKSTSRPRFKAYYRTAAGTWTYWAQGPLLLPSDTYQYAEWLIPQAPEGAVGVSVGLSLDRAGTFVADDFTLEDLGPGSPIEAPPAGR